MKRLHFIYYAAPLTVALNTLPGMLGGIWRVVVTVVLALVLWGVVWVRLFTNKKLRPEFAILSILPPCCYYLMSVLSPEFRNIFTSPGWQNFNFFLWLVSIFISIRALLPTPKEHQGRLATDSVLIFMSIITTVYGLVCWAGTHASFIN
ncbi:MAG: hypothetical protein IKW48_00235 [Akkermansia sp.]|nr:hypothetical protein [Akkermansia sp.]